MTVLEWVGTIGFIAAAIGLNVFIVTYASKKPWDAPYQVRRVGMRMFWYMLTMAFIFDLALAFRLIINDAHPLLEAWLAALLWPILALVIWRLTFSVFKNGNK